MADTAPLTTDGFTWKYTDEPSCGPGLHNAMWLINNSLKRTKSMMAKQIPPHLYYTRLYYQSNSTSTERIIYRGCLPTWTEVPGVFWDWAGERQNHSTLEAMGECWGSTAIYLLYFCTLSQEFISGHCWRQDIGLDRPLAWYNMAVLSTDSLRKRPHLRNMSRPTLIHTQAPVFSANLSWNGPAVFRVV